MVKRVSPWMGGTGQDNRNTFTVTRANSNVEVGTSANANATLRVFGKLDVKGGPFTTDSTALVANLNADQLDSRDSTSFAPSNANYIVFGAHSQLSDEIPVSSLHVNAFANVVSVPG